MTYGHLQADCLYTGISSGPNARYRVWEASIFTFYLFIFYSQVFILFTYFISVSAWRQVRHHTLEYLTTEYLIIV